jgi:hypothetical protein
MRLLRGRQDHVRGRARLEFSIYPVVTDDDAPGDSRATADRAPRVVSAELIDSAIAVAFVGTYGLRRCGIASVDRRRL